MQSESGKNSGRAHIDLWQTWRNFCRKHTMSARVSTDARRFDSISVSGEIPQELEEQLRRTIRATNQLRTSEANGPTHTPIVGSRLPRRLSHHMRWRGIGVNCKRPSCRSRTSCNWRRCSQRMSLISLNRATTLWGSVSDIACVHSSLRRSCFLLFICNAHTASDRTTDGLMRGCANSRRNECFVSWCCKVSYQFITKTEARMRAFAGPLNFEV